jgi:hypothetical protein
MKRSYIVLFLLSVLLFSCKKNDTIPTSGTVTINNKTFKSTTYYVFGFSFANAKKVSTLASPGPDVIVFVNSDSQPSRLTLQANNLFSSFYKFGDYPDAASATAAFRNLKTVGNYTWDEVADPIEPNQVWLYRSGNQTYAKIRIISIVNETRDDLPYGECTFEWVFQPDGSTTFPGA